MTDQQKRWGYLSTLEEQARTVLKWEAIKIASASQQELEMALAEFRRIKEQETKHEHGPDAELQQQQEEEEEELPYMAPVIIDLTSHCTNHTQNAQEHFMKQLIVCYCAASLQPVTAATIESVLFAEQKK